MGCHCSKEEDSFVITDPGTRYDVEGPTQANPFLPCKTETAQQCLTCGRMVSRRSFERGKIRSNECNDCFDRRLRRWQREWYETEGRRQIMIHKALGKHKTKVSEGTQT